MRKNVHRVEVNTQTPVRAKSKRTQRNTKSPKKTGKTGTPPPNMDNAVEYWWICAELARFLATTTQEQFRKVCRQGEQFVYAILQEIRQMTPIYPALDIADVFLSCEGWNYAQKVWLMGHGDQNVAFSLIGRYEMAGHCCDEHEITQDALLRWNCLEQSHLFDHSGKDEAAALGILYPPTNFSNPNIPKLLTILEAVEETTAKNPDTSGTTPKKSKPRKTRGKGIPRHVKLIVADWLNGPDSPDPESDWPTNYESFRQSEYYKPAVKPYCMSLTAFKNLVRATRKALSRGSL